MYWEIVSLRAKWNCYDQLPISRLFSTLSLKEKDEKIIFPPGLINQYQES